MPQSEQRRQADRNRKRLHRSDTARRRRELDARNRQRSAVHDTDPWITEPGWRYVGPAEPADRGPFAWDRTRDGRMDANRCVECDRVVLVDGGVFCSVVCSHQRATVRWP